MMTSEDIVPEPLFLDLASESEDPSVTEISSLCLQCQQQGTTRLLLTLIPYFKRVMVSSFSCPHCHFTNSSLLNVGEIQPKGIKYTLGVTSQADLRRMVVRSDYASVAIPEVELEMTSGSGKGEITNVEGLLSKVIANLQLDQAVRREADPEGAEKIDEFINKLGALMELQEPFTVKLDDPSGNSFIERLSANGLRDPALSWSSYDRSPQQDELLGIAPPQDDNNNALEEVAEENEDADEEVSPESKDSGSQAADTESRDQTDRDDVAEKENLANEVLKFSELCDRCHRPAQTNMKLVKIPYFKEVVIMASVCDHCGNKTSEVKSGSGISPTGRRIVLKLDDPELDLARDVLKSEMCDLQIPELELHVGAGILGGKFTTIEGLLISIKDDMKNNPFFVGDSVDPVKKAAVDKIFNGIDKIMAGELKATFIMDDPSGNSYLQNVYAPDPDPFLEITEYERTFQQNEDLGLNDIKTEGYEND